MKKTIFKILSKFFRNQIEESFIEQEIKEFNFDKKSNQIYGSLSDLYQYPEYKVFSKMISNRAKAIGFKSAKSEDYNEKKHSRTGGEIYCTALILKMVKFANIKHQNRGGLKRG